MARKTSNSTSPQTNKKTWHIHTETQQRVQQMETKWTQKWLYRKTLHEHETTQNAEQQIYL